MSNKLGGTAIISSLRSFLGVGDFFISREMSQNFLGNNWREISFSRKKKS
jgi:hypothetical protein